MSARDAGARVVVLEAAPEELRGGNTSYSGGTFAFPQKGLSEIRELMPDLSDAEAATLDMPAYTADQMYSTWMNLTKGFADAELAEAVIAQGNQKLRWLLQLGLKLELFTTFAIRSGGRIKWQSGQNVVGAKSGGLGLSEALFAAAEKRGVEFRYGTKAVRLVVTDKGEVRGVVAKGKDGFQTIKSKGVILGCGGFEANREMRARYLGKKWDVVRIRGTRYNVGDGLRMALEAGAQPWGQWSSCHGVLLDANASYIPNKKVGDSTNRSATCCGILVNCNGKRFLDEGEDVRTATYAKFGEAALDQPGGIAFQVFDAKVQYLLEDRYATTTPVTAASVEELADKLRAPDLVETIKDFNAAVQEGTFDPVRKDGKCTIGVEPPKSNWALKLDTPPLLAYPVTGGITFTYGGLKINTKAQVLDFDDRAIPGLYACGEIVGGLFYYAYVGGGSLMAGGVFGSAAGAGAAQE